MSDFMDDGRPDLVPDLVLRRGELFDRSLEDEDHVRRNISVIGAALVERDAVVKAEKIPGGAEAQVGDDFGGGEVFDQDGHVLDPVPEILRKAVDRFGDQFLELFPG